MHIWLIEKYHCLLQRNKRNVEIYGTTTDMAKYSNPLWVLPTAATWKGTAWNSAWNPEGFSCWETLVWSDRNKVHQLCSVKYVIPDEWLLILDIYTAVINMTVQRQGFDSPFFFSPTHPTSAATCSTVHYVMFDGGQINVDGTMEMKQTHCIYNTKRLQSCIKDKFIHMYTHMLTLIHTVQSVCVQCSSLTHTNTRAHTRTYKCLFGCTSQSLQLKDDHSSPPPIRPEGRGLGLVLWLRRKKEGSNSNTVLPAAPRVRVRSPEANRFCRLPSPPLCWPPNPCRWQSACGRWRAAWRRGCVAECCWAQWYRWSFGWQGGRCGTRGWTVRRLGEVGLQQDCGLCRSGSRSPTSGWCSRRQSGPGRQTETASCASALVWPDTAGGWVQSAQGYTHFVQPADPHIISLSKSKGRCCDLIQPHWRVFNHEQGHATASSWTRQQMITDEQMKEIKQIESSEITMLHTVNNKAGDWRWMLVHTHARVDEGANITVGTNNPSIRLTCAFTWRNIQRLKGATHSSPLVEVSYVH